MSRRWVTLTWTFLQKADGCRIFHQCESHDECKEILRMFANFKEETIHWLGTIHILRKNVLGDFLTHHLCTVSKQKWPISEPTHKVQCLRNTWMVPYTLGFLAKISFTLLLYHPGRCLGCPEKQTSSRNYNLFVWSAVFQPKWNDI